MLRRSFSFFRSGALLVAVLPLAAFAQTSVQTGQWNTAADGQWFIAGNWSPAVVPDFSGTTSYRAVIAQNSAAYVVTASGASHVDLAGLDISSATARLVFDFSATSISLNLASGVSNWTAGNVEFRNGNGIVGTSNTSTTINVSNGVEVLFNTATASRTISSLAYNNSGLLRATTGTLSISGALFSNQSTGIVHADGAEIIFQSGTTLSNTGLLRATGGTGILRFAGSVTTGGLGAIDLVSGGRARLTGTLNNSAATLNAPTGGSWELLGGTITGGTIGSNALLLSSSGGTLNGVTLTGTVTVPASTHGNFGGTNALNSATVTFGTSAYYYLTGANSTLTIDAPSTVTGDIRLISDGSVGTAYTNQGTLTHNAASSGEIYARTFTNTGTITATASSLGIGSTSVGYNTNNSGTITANGSSAIVYVDGNVANTGTLAATNAGRLTFRGANTTANLGTVQLSSGGRALLDGSLNNALATLAAPTGGSFELFSGTITGGTIASNALLFTSSGGTLSGVTLTGTVTVPASTHALISGNSVLNAATVSFGTSAYYYLTGANSTLTINAPSTISGDIRLISDSSLGTAYTNHGTITHNAASSGEIYARTFTNVGTLSVTSDSLQIGSTSSGWNTNNSGTMTANGSTAILYLDGNVANTGTLAATNAGRLNFRGPNTTANLGAIQLTSGGRALLDGSLNNTSAILTAPTGGMFELFSGTITGGTVASNALTFTSSGGTLNNVTLNGTVNFPASTHALVAGTTTTFASATVTLNNAAYIYLNAVGATLTIDTLSTVSGDIRLISDSNTGTTYTNQGSIAHTASSSGEIYARTFNNTGTITTTANSLFIGSTTSGYNTNNSGTITADGSTAIVYLDGNVANTGTLAATNAGRLIFRGPNTTGNLGSVQLTSGGRALLDGTLNNASATLNPPTSGIFELFSGTISGGTIASNALTFTSSGGTLNNVSLNGTVNFPASTHALVAGTTTTLASATVTMNSAAYVYLNAVGATLTIDTLSTVSGDIRLISDSNTGTTYTNQGSIAHTDSSSGEIYARTFNNTGTVTTTTGALHIGSVTSGYNTNNSGTITANGSTAIVYLDGNVANTGTLAATNAGRLIFRGPNITANLGSVQLSAGGRALLDGTLNNTAATLNPPASGIFELFSGTISGGTVASNALTFTSSGGTLNGVALQGTVNLPASSAAFIAGNTLLAGATANFGTSAYVYLNNAAASLTIDSASSAAGDLRILSDSSAGTVFNNHGSLTHNAPSTGEIYARTFNNTGTVNVTNDALFIGSTSSGWNTNNTGTMTANGSAAVLYLDGNVANTGTLSALNAGRLIFRGSNTTGNLGTVQLASGGRALLGGTINNAAATLNPPAAGIFELFGGTITGGTIAANALAFTNSGGTLNNVTLTGTQNVPVSSFAYFTGNSTLSGASATFGTNSFYYLINANSSLTFDSASVLTGDVRIFSDSSAGSVLTNHGLITHNAASSGEIYGRTFNNTGTVTATNDILVLGTTSTGYNTNNSGTILANGTNAAIYLDGNVANTGTLAAQNAGRLIFRGNNTTPNLGTVQLTTGGRALFDGTLNNTGSTLNAPATGIFELLSGTITGGTIASNALTFTNSGGYLDGVTLLGTVNIPTNAYTYLRGTNTLSGASATLATNAFLYLINANSSFTIGSGSSVTGDIRLISDGTAGSTFTNLGAILHNVSNFGEVYARNFTNAGTVTATAGTLEIGLNSTGYDTFNTGTITASGSGTTIYLQANVANTGTLAANNAGRFIYEGPNTTANLGTVQLLSGGRALFNGALNNTAATLTAPVSGFFELFGGTITGGTIGSNALRLTTSGGTLSGVNISGTFTLPNSSHTEMSGANTLTAADLTFGTSSFMRLNGASATLTIDGSSTLVGDVSLSSFSHPGTSIVNFGSISHTSLSTGSISARTVTNLGVLSSTAGGNLVVGLASSTGTTVENAAGGTINLSGGDITTSAAFTNQGLIRVTAGTLTASATFVNLAGGVVTGAGTFRGDLNFAGGTIAPGNSIGALTFPSSSFNVTQGTLLEIELGGASADSLVFSNPTAPVNIGSGLLALSLNLLSAPTLGTAYDIVRISAGGSGITGTFAGLPSSGNHISANFLGTPYLFAVNYQLNAISLQAVPEPETYAMLGAGAVLVVLLRRRRARGEGTPPTS